MSVNRNLTGVLGLLVCSLLTSTVSYAETPEMTRGEHCLSRFKHQNSFFNDAVRATLADPMSFVILSTSISSVGPKGRHLAKMTYRSKAGPGVAYAAIDHVTCHATLIHNRAEGVALFGS